MFSRDQEMKYERISLTPSVLVFLCGFLGTSLRVSAENPPSESVTEKGNSPTTMLDSESAVLVRFLGSWNLVETHYSSDGKISATVKGTEEIAWSLDKRAIRRTYASGTGESVFRAVGMLTWNSKARLFEGSWFDNHSTTGPQIVASEWMESTTTMSHSLASVTDGASKPSFKIIERFTDADNRTATTFRVQGDRVEKMLEVKFVRTIPCPAESAGLRLIGEPIGDPPKED